jgi:hypothetical protein
MKELRKELRKELDIGIMYSRSTLQRRERLEKDLELCKLTIWLMWVLCQAGRAWATQASATQGHGSEYVIPANPGNIQVVRVIWYVAALVSWDLV